MDMYIFHNNQIRWKKKSSNPVTKYTHIKHLSMNKCLVYNNKSFTTSFNTT